MKNIDTETV